MSGVIELEDGRTPIDPVAGWRRWIGRDGEHRGELLISRRVEAAGAGANASAPGASRVRLLRHPGLARVLEASTDADGVRVIEEIGRARPLSEEPRLPRGEALAEQLLRLLQALAYMHRQGLTHGSVSPETVFSDGRELVLTGATLTSTAAGTSADVSGWANLVTELLGDADDPGTSRLLRESAAEVRERVHQEQALDATAVVGAIERSRRRPMGEMDPDGVTDESERSWQMRALIAIGHFLANTIVGLFTTVLTIAVIGGAVTLGVMWFLGQLPQETQMPMVVKMERERAVERLEQEGLSVGHIRRVYRENVEAGHVAETVPPPGMTVREGREVTLVVSMGAARVKAPRLVGLRLDEAKGVLEKQGLKLVDGGKVRSNAPEGEIVEQDPPPGRKIAQGERVVAQTSGGPQFGVVEVVGDDEDESSQRMVFRRIEIVVPRGDALQRVVVREGYGDDLEETYDRLHRPGDRVKLETSGRPGKVITVTIEGDVVFKTQL